MINFGNFFVSDRPIMFSHRAGNNIKDINTAFRKGANFFDIDAAADTSGEIYGEHGFILNNIFNTKVNLVIDFGEGEIRATLPTRIEDLIKHIHSLSTQENPLGISIDIKYGQFNKETLKKLIDLIYEYQMPAIIAPNTGEQLLNIRKIIEERKNAT
jgi:hypothetical protein